MNKKALLKSALQILAALGLPKGQQNERSALSLLALLNLQPKRNWLQAESPLMGITPIMDWIRDIMTKPMHPIHEKRYGAKPCTNSLTLALPSTIPTIRLDR
jgi:hypothetical protein